MAENGNGRSASIVAALIGAIATGALGIGTGYVSLASKLSGVEATLGAMRQEINRIETQMDRMERKQP